jgi:diguanylate cyclase (GGDEF)-like protein
MPVSAEASRILIVDDIDENRAFLARRLKRRGFEVVEADGGAAALDCLAREPVDLVLLDVMMPEIDGLEVLRRIRGEPSPVLLPVIMVTAKHESEDIVRALELGANDYVAKPIDFAVLLARIQTQVARKRAEEGLQRANTELERRVAERTAALLDSNRRLEAEVAQRKRSEARVQHMAYHDALTNLGNRLLLRENLEQRLVRLPERGETLAIVALGLDFFKTVNETLGPAVGDALLRKASERLRNEIGENDVLARLGGDEFGIVLGSLDEAEETGAIARRLIATLSAPYEIDGHQVVVGASAGITVCPGDGVETDRLLKNADLALYRAKTVGRGTFRFFEPEMDARAQARRALEADLRKALANGEFEIHYQPLVSLDSNRVSGFEALLRWHHPERGLIPPLDFIPLAEEIGLIAPVGEWVLREACAQATTWPDEIKLSVNLSPVQFKGGRLAQTVMGALAASGLAPNRLDLEITEMVLLHDDEGNRATLHRLRDLGIGISIDDFGTGYSSLSYLRSFPFDKIKIDKSFVRDLSSRLDCDAIIRAVAGLGATLGVTTTAEGVETEEQLEKLRERGCGEVQGYLFSRPIPAAEVARLITRLNGAARRAA